MKIKIALMTTNAAGRNAVKVDTEYAKFTLGGTVDSQAVKNEAEATARAFGAVTDVRNLHVPSGSRQPEIGGLL